MTSVGHESRHSPLERDRFVQLMPHAGRMCLVDRIERWDEQSLDARCWSHRAADHPLARDGRLAALHAIEYGAQAMAVHGALLAERDGERLARGFLAGARDLRFQRERLDDLADDLEIAVERRFAQAGSLIYAFRIDAGGEPVADGMATVVSR